MGKAKGVSRRRRKKYNYNVNRRRLHKKSLSLPKIQCKIIKDAWDNKKSILKNMKEMGFSADPNKSLLKSSKVDVGLHKKDQSKFARKPSKLHIMETLDAEASAPQPKAFRLPNSVVKYCAYMIEKYGENYKAMARDPKNYYQDTPKQIQKKINTFKSIPEQWNGYLKAKGLLKDASQTPDEEMDLSISNEQICQ